MCKQLGTRGATMEEIGVINSEIFIKIEKPDEEETEFAYENNPGIFIKEEEPNDIEHVCMIEADVIIKEEITNDFYSVCMNESPAFQRIRSNHRNPPRRRIKLRKRRRKALQRYEFEKEPSPREKRLIARKNTAEKMRRYLQRLQAEKVKLNEKLPTVNVVVPCKKEEGSWLHCELGARVRREDLFDVWKNESDTSAKNNAIVNYVIKKIASDEHNKISIYKIVRYSRTLCKQFSKKWKQSWRNVDRFLMKNKRWLEKSIIFDECHPAGIYAERMESPLERSPGNRQTFATVVDLSPCGERGSRMKHLIPQKICIEKALALYIESEMTKSQYISVRKHSKQHGANIYPNYDSLLDEKKNCYPSDISIDEFSAEIKLQSLVEHTVRRILSVHYDILKNLFINRGEIEKIDFQFKWGCDMAVAYNNGKQVFNLDVDDSVLLSFSIIPLKCVAKIKENEEQLDVWQNPSPSSTKYCRPIKIIIHKEDENFIVKEIEKIKFQIQSILPVSYQVNNTSIPCYSSFVLFKICRWPGVPSGENCHLCGSLLKDVTNTITKNIDEENSEYGISILYAWIKALECLLHIAYRLELCRMEIREEDEEKVNLRKKEIQDQFWGKFGLVLNAGNSNVPIDHLTARIFFGNPELASEITGIDMVLIKRIGIILIAISCGHSIDRTKFNDFCIATAKLYVSLYPWYNMPQILHEILIHGSELISDSFLPIGLMAERVLEYLNEDKSEFQVREMCCSQTLKDMIHRLLVLSDPVVSSFRKTHPKKDLPEEVLPIITDCESEAESNCNYSDGENEKL